MTVDQSLRASVLSFIYRVKKHGVEILHANLAIPATSPTMLEICDDSLRPLQQLQPTLFLCNSFLVISMFKRSDTKKMISSRTQLHFQPPLHLQQHLLLVSLRWIAAVFRKIWAGSQSIASSDSMSYVFCLSHRSTCHVLLVQCFLLKAAVPWLMPT